MWKLNWPNFRSIKLAKASKGSGEVESLSSSWSEVPEASDLSIDTSIIGQKNSMVDAYTQTPLDFASIGSTSPVITPVLNNNNNFLDSNILDNYIQKNEEVLDITAVLEKLMEYDIVDPGTTIFNLFPSGLQYLSLGLAAGTVGILGIGCLTLISSSNKIPNFSRIIENININEKISFNLI